MWPFLFTCFIHAPWDFGKKTSATRKAFPTSISRHEYTKFPLCTPVSCTHIGCFIPRILNLGTKRRWVVIFTPCSLYPRWKQSCYQLTRRLGESWSQSSFYIGGKPLPAIENWTKILVFAFRSLAANRLWYFGSSVKIGLIDGFYEHFSKYYFEYKVENFLTTWSSVSLFTLNSNMIFSLQIMASVFIEVFLQLSYTVSIPWPGCRLDEGGILVRFPWERKEYSLRNRVHNGSGDRPDACTVSTRDTSPKTKRTKIVAKYSTPFSVEVVKEWRYSCSCAYVILNCKGTASFFYSSTSKTIRQSDA